MNLLKGERPSRSLTRLPAAATPSGWRVDMPPTWKRFLRALLRGLAVGAA